MSDPVIYDWPSSVVPARQLFHAGGQAVEGGFSSGSVRMLHPEPGGVSWLEMEFAYQDNGDPDPLVSWLMSKIANGNIFRVRIERSPQLVSARALGVDIAESDPLYRFGLRDLVAPTELDGLPWDNNQPWDGGRNWRFDPGALVVATALEGGLMVQFDMGALSNGLRPGHVIGHSSVSYLIDDIEYSGSVATVTLMSPLRKDAAVGDFISFRPVGLFTAINPDAFRGLYESADLVKLGSIQFMEAII